MKFLDYMYLALVDIALMLLIVENTVKTNTGHMVMCVQQPRIIPRSHIQYYGPRIGALYIRGLGHKTPVYPLFYGGGQERGYRPGTENTPMIAGLGRASLLVHNNVHDYYASMKKTRNYMERQLKVCIL